jgi:GDPmannose 4,6-dehydratase
MLLLSKGYEVWGSSRDAQISGFLGLRQLGVFGQVKTLSMSLIDFRSVLQGISKVQPHEIYNLAGQSSVGLSFEQPVETAESITNGVLNLLEAIRFLDKRIRFYNAGSSECFGDTGSNFADEETPMRPISPYAIAKAAATWQVALYRRAYGLHASTGILFNHESPLRPDRFVTKKIVTTACRISLGSQENLQLGNIDIRRDWGWAPEYVDAMWRMLNQNDPQDFVIATGVTLTLREFLEVAFDCLGLDWQDHTSINRDLIRPSDPLEIKGSPLKAARFLSWTPKLSGVEVVKKLVSSEITSRSGRVKVDF